MFVFTPSARTSSRVAPRQGSRVAAVECLGLVTSTVLVLIGIFLTYEGRTRSVVSAIKAGTIVRTPEEFATEIRLAVMMFVGAFWSVHLVRRWLRAVGDRRADPGGDPFLLPIVVMLTGIGVMSMIALRDPLRDTVLAYRFVLGIAAGCALLVAAASVDFEAWRFRCAVALPLSIALGAVALLLAFGSGPGASGAKVNLFGVQPVEAIRLLVIFALAGYFSRRGGVPRGVSPPSPQAQPWASFARPPPVGG